MPTYILKCPDCGTEEEVICSVEDRNSYACSCEPNVFMRVKITTANFRMRHGRPDVIEWKKQRGVLDL